ncbi:MAG: DUF3859 domain-containing protein [Planctomycetes bacterium]|nr:DUF3859 domain-containing protein [Planctomycetota bacterium]
MKKGSRLQFSMRSYGIYESWDGDSKSVPRIKEFTTDIPCRIGIEFGYVLHLRHARGEKLDFEIDHAPWLNADGDPEPSFCGEFYIRDNDFDFFLGDTIWQPWQDKCGPWCLRTWHNGVLLAEKTFELIDPDEFCD